MPPLPATNSDRMKGDVFRRLTCFLALLSTGTALPAFAQDPDRPIRAIGDFSNVRYTEEHAYGYTVELWRDGNSAIGLFLVSEGLQGDTPMGMLENVRFDSRTGANQIYVFEHPHGDARKRKI